MAVRLFIKGHYGQSDVTAAITPTHLFSYLGRSAAARS